jgi:hypothetical protein
MPDSLTYTADQVARAARELREAAGASQQRYTAPEVIAMLSDEVRLLRERGFSDERIADLFTGFDIQTSAEEIAQFAQPAPSPA